eukprot:TRINITY_DN8910_c0_g3_i1.p1 TRINITY_DN8910_c0_g3~~TRINITY_DN8910_c0_g3_i1.p1  ORF type:complete len:573 (+),score=99.67 TRINITY_DN8910_c0_g3_i1:244-1719(+)
MTPTRSKSPVGPWPTFPPQDWNLRKGLGLQTTPQSPEGFAGCWSAKVSPDRTASSSSSYAVFSDVPRLSFNQFGSTPSKAQETMHLLMQTIRSISELPVKESDRHIDAFRDFHRYMTRAVQMSRGSSAEEFFGSLEPKRDVLRFIANLHRWKKMYTKQTAFVLNALMKSDSWHWALLEDEELLESFAEDLRRCVPERDLNKEPPRPTRRLASPHIAKLPLACFSKPSPSKQEVMAAVQQEVNIRKQRRATRGPQLPAAEMLIQSQTILEAHNYSAAGDRDEVNVAFELFGKAVRRITNLMDSCEKDEEVTCQGLLELSAFEPKERTLTFLTDLAERKEMYRSRIASVLHRLGSISSWKDVVADHPLVQRLAAEGVSPLASSPEQSPEHSPEHSPEPSGSEDDEDIKALDLDDKSQVKVEEVEKELRQKAPWYLRVCFRIFGVVSALRKCRCLIPRHLQDAVEPLLDSVQASAATGSTLSGEVFYPSEDLDG